MNIGIVKEVKIEEYRVSTTPAGVQELTAHGHTVWVESGAGEGSGFTDAEYEAKGATIVPTAQETWERADMVIKVKEPQPSEYPFLREDLILYTYLHLAAEESLTRAMLDSGVIGLAYETVELPNGVLPLLQPMSEVAGRMATQVASHYLEKPQGGRGKLMGGIPGVLPADVVILGGGTVGTQAAWIAAGMRASVTILDISLSRLYELDEMMPANVKTMFASQANVTEMVAQADVLIGAVLIPGARAPHLVTREMVGTMRKNSVIVDVAVDQGGCVETTHPTTHDNPTYYVDDVLHYGVANMPGAVPRTSTLGLSNATLHYALQIADNGLEAAIEADEALRKGVNTYHGKLVYEPVAQAFGLEYTELTFT